nr:reverse transcriptase domain-containing protein [Tanacetum cinerariifolium]
MSTRSSTRNLFPPLDNPELTIRRRSRVVPTLLNDFEMDTNRNGDDVLPLEGGDLPVLDLRTMEELCQPTLNARGGPIAPIAIQATNFGIKNDIIQQVQNSCQFHGLPGDDANKHLDKFLHVIQSIKVNGVTDYSLPLNEITNFRQHPDESLFEAWESYKLLTDRCLNHNMLPVTQIDTFYYGLTLRHRDTINAAAGGTFMKRRPEECYNLIENMTTHHNDWNTSIQRRIKETIMEFLRGTTKEETSSSTELVMVKTCLQLNKHRLIKPQGLTIPTTSSPPKVVECETEVTKDTVPPTNKGSTKDIQPPVVQIETQIPNSEPVNTSKPNPKPSIPYPSRLHNQKLHDKANDQKEKFFQIFQDLNFNISFVNALILMPKFSPTIKSLLTTKDILFELVRTPLNGHCSAVLLKKLPEKLRDPGKFLIPCDFPGMDECLALADLGASINLMPLFVWNKLSLPELSPTCMTLELTDRSISRPVGVAEDVFVKVGTFHFSGDFGDILLLEEFLNDDTSSPPIPPQELKVVEPKNKKKSIDEPPVVKLKDLPPHLKYAFLEGDDKLPVIIAKDLTDEEKTALIKVLKSHKQALAWQLFDIKVGSESCPPMLNKENYVPWSSRLLRYAKSRLNGKLIHNSILNGPYVRRMIPKPGDANREVTVTETFHLQTDDALSDKMPSCSMSGKDLLPMKGNRLSLTIIYNQKEVDELKPKRIAKIQDPLALMENSNNPYAFPAPHQDQSSFNQNYLQQPMLNPKEITDPTNAMNMALTLMAKAFKLNYSTSTNNNQRISSNPRNRQYVGQNVGNLAGYNDVIGNQNHIGNGNLVAARAEGNTAGQNGNQIRCYNCRGVGYYARNCTVRPRRRDAAYLQTQLFIAQKKRQESNSKQKNMI